ncbi:hypothetical protein PTSG_03677 [Salpingoeca rosetta]|uniref:Calmodulin n=1 Tax=Salpingoeca rosetta (strain ATCC 50818 / BSB-021) TaxID=946362 RepID=F2U698_SALR5|nr:uncharacterized protein PTSG_03677 [Salpingoeca rosetta]EGD83039.1 hypothetical protein PTSG_03677 [Salpingoeca rosetta]|eukprot:XP_004995403.1 hypothetical protein PTSG_03677 [Salpingoeca rosetta]
MSSSASTQSAQRLFNILDQNESGYIEREELDQFLYIIGVVDEDLRKQQIPAILQEMDLDGDGRISFQEFVTVAEKMGLDFETTLQAAETGPDQPLDDSMVTNVSMDDSQMTQQQHASDTPSKHEARPASGRAAKRSSMTAVQAMTLFDELDMDGDGKVEGNEIAHMLGKRCGITNEREQDLVLNNKFGIARDECLSQEQFLALNLEGKLDMRMLRNPEPKELSAVAMGMSRQNAVVNTPPPKSAVTKMMPKDKLDTLWQLFNIADEDRDGTIGMEELSSMLQDESLLGKYGLALGHLDADITERIMQDVDSSGDGVLDFDEFCLAFSGLLESGTQSGMSTIIAAEARALLEENKKLKKQLKSEKDDAASYRRQMEHRVKSENLDLLESHESVEAELRQALDKIKTLEKAKRLSDMQLRELRQTLAEYKERNDMDSSALLRKAADASDEGIKIHYLEKQLKDLHDHNEVLERALTDTLKEKDNAEASAKAELSAMRERIGQLKAEKEHLEVALADSKRVTSQSTSSEATTDTGDASDLHTDLKTLQQQLASQKALAFDLTNERDSLQKEVRQLRAKEESDKSAASSSGASKQEMESLNARLNAAMIELRDTREQSKQLETRLLESEAERTRGQESMDEIKSKLEEYEADQARLEEERKEVVDMKKEMEALQAMVVAQTAELAMRGEPQAEIEQLRSELDLQRKLTEEAEARAKEAVDLREKALAASHSEAQPAAAADTSSVNKRLGGELNTSTQTTTLQNIQAMAALRKENKTLKSMLKRLHEAYKKKSAGSADEELARLRKELQTACAEIARLTVELDTARQSRQSTSHHSREAEELARELADKNAVLLQMEEALQSSEERLQNALETIRTFRDQACVQIEVKKETIHTREKRNGQRVPVDKKQEQKIVTYFTDAKNPELRSSPWSEAEDRVLLQGQLQLGGDWVEIAKLLPGRSDEDIANRWTVLSQALTAKARNRAIEQRGISPTSTPNGVRNQQDGSVDHVYAMARNQSVMSRKSEGIYELADVEDQEKKMKLHNKHNNDLVGAAYDEPSLLATV